MKTSFTAFTKFIALSLLLLLSASCNDKEEASPSIPDLLEGAWTKGEVKAEEYDASGKLLGWLETSSEKGRVYELNNGELKITFAEGVTFEGTYKVRTEGPRHYVDLSSDVEQDEYLVTFLTENELVWKREYEHSGPDEVANTADDEKRIHIEKFTR